jgi:predicted exporter
VQVQNGLPPDEDTPLPSVIQNHRFVLTDLDFSQTTLNTALQERLQDLAFGGGSQIIQLIAADPYLSLLQIFERLTPMEFSGELWFSDDGQAVLLAETRAPATDIGAQAHAIGTIHDALASLDPSGEFELDTTGVGAFGVELQRTIRREATLRSIAASLMLLIVLAVAYRGPRKVLLAGIPLAMGALCGLALVAIVFEEVHGITLAFGFTLLGIAIDYPLHLFSHARSERPAIAITKIWPTLRIGALSTLLAYLAIMFAGSRGLAQIGLFTAGGLVTAVATTRWLLPRLLSTSPLNGPRSKGEAERPRLLLYPAVLALLIAATGVWAFSSSPFWQDDLSSLSPLPSDRLIQDNRLRSVLGTADMRYQLVLQDADLESLLQKNEQLESRLSKAVADDILVGWHSVSALLPSLQLQKRRLARIPSEEQLAQRLESASAGLPFRSGAFTPFLDAASEARRGPLLTPESYRGTSLRARWVSLIFLVEPNAAALTERIGTWPGDPVLTDIRASSNGLLGEFRARAVRAVGWAALLILGLLFLDRHLPRRIIWLALTVTAALTVTVALVSLFHEQLNVIHLIGLLLVFGLGLDYALFFSRTESQIEQADSRHALVACAVSTALAFSMLGTSSIPLIKNLGVTVALGSAISFLIAWVGRRTSAAGLN